MIKVKQLYVLWTSDYGDQKLIPKDEYDKFIEDLKKAEMLFDNEVLYTAWEDRNPDRELELQQDIYNLIDKYNTLEGEEVFVVLQKDVIKGDEA